MDLRAFFQLIREVEKQIVGDYAVVMSMATPDGGKAGVLTEVSRTAAARLVTEQRARLATTAENEQYTSQHKPLDAPAMPVDPTGFSDSDLRLLRKRFRPDKV